METPDDWCPSANVEAIRLRAHVNATVRAFFAARDVLEVETPILSQAGNTDPNIASFSLEFGGHVDAGPRQRWLRTSPEFPLKRLLAAGLGDCYELGRVFRDGEAGGRHNPEFTMLEWYRVGDDYRAGMNLLAELAGEMFGVSEVMRITYREAFQKYAGVDPLAELPASVDPSEREFQLDVLLTSQIQPQLGQGRPAILYDYPANQAALAQVRQEGGIALAERFELYCQGVELANGYHELLAPEVLRERNRLHNQERAADQKYTLPEESRLLDAMEHGLPACSGCALGVDRLVMLLAGTSSIQDVIAFPIDRA